MEESAGGRNQQQQQNMIFQSLCEQTTNVELNGWNFTNLVLHPCFTVWCLKKVEVKVHSLAEDVQEIYTQTYTTSLYGPIHYVWIISTLTKMENYYVQ